MTKTEKKQLNCYICIKLKNSNQEQVNQNKTINTNRK